MRIAIVAAPWWPVPPPKWGPSSVVIDGLARGLRKLGQEVVLFATNDSDCPVFRYPTSISSEAQHRHESVGIEVQFVAEAYSHMREFDGVHDHTLVGPLYARAFPHLQTIVTTNHGPFNGILSPIFAAIASWVEIVAISHSQASTAPAAVPISDVIHHGVDTDRLSMGTGSGGYLLFLGRMIPEKGVSTAIRVARKVGLPLLIGARMQTDSEIEYFETEVKPLLGVDAEYVGEVDAIEKVGLLQGARALLNPIQWMEPLGLVILESLACGTPVISYAKGSASELIEHGKTGFLAVNEAELVTACSQIDEIDRVKCRCAAEQRFSLERMASDHLTLYKRLLRSGGTRKPSNQEGSNDLSPILRDKTWARF
jgi:glycosyltransferase involved in cell wall biosynthesis